METLKHRFIKCCKTKYQWLWVGFVSVLVGIINIFQVIIGLTKTPKDFTYLAVGHFYLDYFEYLQQIVQGMRGHWLVDNPFDVNDPTKTFLGWGQYLLIGRLANFFHWSPYFTYWFAIFILSIVLCFLLFKLIKRLLPEEMFFIQFCAWLMAIFATPFIKIISENGQLKTIPFDFWYAPMSMFHRFGGVPHHLLTSILIILIILFTAKILSNLDKLNFPQLIKKALINCLMLASLLTFAPFQVINIMSGLALVGWIYFKKTNKLVLFIGLTIIIVLPLALIFKNMHQTDGLFQRQIFWETAQNRYRSMSELLLTTGPILIFVPFGIIAYLKSKTPLRLLFLFFVIFCYIYLYTPLALYFGTHNTRFLTPLVYPLFSVLAVLGMKIVTSWLSRKRILFVGLILILLSYFLFVTHIIYKSFAGVDQLSYLPNEYINGLKILDKQSDSKAVFTSPGFSLGLIVPSLVDRKVYLGRTIFTPDYEKRNNISDQFYKRQIPVEQAKQLMIDNNIGYVILSSPLESYQYADIEQYPFLKKIFENKTVRIYKIY